MHRHASVSLLSGLTLGGKEPTNLTGFINLVFLMFVLTNMRLVVENALRHGFLIELPVAPEPGVQHAELSSHQETPSTLPRCGLRQPRRHLPKLPPATSADDPRTAPKKWPPSSTPATRSSA